jgi:hypothetical protein
VLLPALLLAGTHLDFKANPALPWIAGAALGARIVAKLAAGWMLSATSKAARKAGPLVGLSLLPSGALAISIGLAFALRFPGPVGDTVLAVAAITATAGEFLGSSSRGSAGCSSTSRAPFPRCTAACGRSRPSGSSFWPAP